MMSGLGLGVRVRKQGRKQGRTHPHDVGVDVVRNVVTFPNLGDLILFLVFVHQVPVFWRKQQKQQVRKRPLSSPRLGANVLTC